MKALHADLITFIFWKEALWSFPALHSAASCYNYWAALKVFAGPLHLCHLFNPAERALCFRAQASESQRVVGVESETFATFLCASLALHGAWCPGSPEEREKNNACLAGLRSLLPTATSQEPLHILFTQKKVLFQVKHAQNPILRLAFNLVWRIYDVSKIQLLVYHQCCVLIGWATTRLYVIAH